MTNNLTDEQNERLARAMGYAFNPAATSGMTTGEFSHWKSPTGRKLSHRCPRFDEPGGPHEELVDRYLIEGSWIVYSNGRQYRAGIMAVGKGPFYTYCSDHPDRTIAECLAVLAYLDYQEVEK